MTAPKECKSCNSYWTHGIKDGVHNRWCCRYGGPAEKKISHCKTMGTIPVVQEACK